MSNPKTAANEGLIRQLGALGIALLALNGMIGAGIFGVPAGAAALAGAWSPMVFVACALLLGAIMLCFAEISSQFDRTGGPILYIDTAFGRFAGFQTGWAFYIARMTAFAANLNLLIESLAYLWPAAGGGWIRVALLTLILGALTWVNVAGIKQAVRSLGVLTLLKLVPLLILIVAGLAWLGLAADAISNTAPPTSGQFTTAALLVIYAYVGWESALVPAGEVKNPARAMPLALFSALALVTVLYVIIQAVSVAALPGLADSERALIDVAEVLMGPAGAMLLTVGVVVSVGGNVAGTMISAPRLTFALAREGNFPTWFGQVHREHHTPANSIVFFATLTLLLSVFGSFVWLAAMSALVRVLIYMACIGAMPRLRKRTGPGGFRLPGGWLIPILAFAASGVLLLQISLQSVLATAAVLAVGTIIYRLGRRDVRADTGSL
ncbi:MAG TPA: APC family permease [Wenzhouxiangellaceae bacterium]|nr:APC family permease [Wenzhouxiangellaceae bacterium]